jgi:hypothetical protein
MDDQKIRRLQEQLRVARQALLTLMSDDLQARFQSFYACKDRRAAVQWEHDLTNDIIDRAKPLGGEQASYFGARGYCPLCGRGSTSPFDRGFALPEGLYRHLSGSGNTAQCDIFETFLSQARDYWEGVFREAEAADSVAKRAELERRRKIEPLFMLSPDDNAVLVDEGLFCERARDDIALKWACDRLGSLAFVKNETDRVQSYTREYGEFIVYADPRIAGKLHFFVHHKDPTERRRTRTLIRAHMCALPDTWKKDLETKLTRLINDVIRRLVAAKKESSSRRD